MSKRQGGMRFFMALREAACGRLSSACIIYMIPDFSLLAAMAAFSLRAG